jgi:uncharacterized membrane protein
MLLFSNLRRSSLFWLQHNQTLYEILKIVALLINLHAARTTKITLPITSDSAV